MTSYGPEAMIATTWIPNWVRFATAEEAEAYIAELAERWNGIVKRTRVVECAEPVNSRWVHTRGLEPLEPVA